VILLSLTYFCDLVPLLALANIVSCCVLLIRPMMAEWTRALAGYMHFCFVYSVSVILFL
jgi:hypothetical protein